MAVTNPRFPLLRLPLKILPMVLELMHVLDLIVFSFISNASKKLITPQFKRLKFSCDWKFYDVPSCELWSKFVRIEVFFRRDKTARFLDARIRDWRYLEKRDYTIQDWLWHLMTVTNQHRIRTVRISSSAETHGFGFKTIQNCTKGFQIGSIEVESDCSAACERRFLDGIHSDELILKRNPYPSQHELQKILMRNYRSITIYLTALIGLNELLLMKCQWLWISDLRRQTNFPMKTLNRFIKLWRKGSNEQLKTMIIITDGTDAVSDVILKGIEHVGVNSRDPRRPVSTADSGRGHEGFDIFGKDGRKATLYIGVIFELNRQIEFRVWKD